MANASDNADREGRAPVWKDQTDFRDSGDGEESIGGWNTIEIVAQGGNVTHAINGQVVFRASGAAPLRGRFLLLSEGAELFVRRLDLTSL